MCNRNLLNIYSTFSPADIQREQFTAGRILLWMWKTFSFFHRKFTSFVILWSTPFLLKWIFCITLRNTSSSKLSNKKYVYGHAHFNGHYILTYCIAY